MESNTGLALGDVAGLGLSSFGRIRVFLNEKLQPIYKPSNDRVL